MQTPRLSFTQRCARLLALLLFAGLSACGGGGGSPPPPPAPAVPPSISAQAQDLSVVDGTSATFTVTASGSTPLSYQWQRNGSDIVGATEARYTIANALLTDSGSRFQVVVTGPGGSITSHAATLTVTPIALTIATQPASQTVPDGTAASFSIQASGSAPISYQWLRNGEAIAGATEASYTTPVLSLQDHETRIQVRVSNPAGLVPSTIAVVGVSAVAPSIKQQPASLTGADGATLSLTVTAAGSAPLRYQWSRNGTPIAGATAATLSLTARYPDSGDRYTVSISNQAGSLQSEPAVITVNPLAAAFSAQPQGATVTTGGSARFSVAVASGTTPMSYQWLRSMDGGASWTAVAGANQSSYSLSNATLADAAARLRVAVTNPAATVYSEAAQLTVQAQVRVLAGSQGGHGYAEGTGSQARLSLPYGIALAPNGDLLVAELGNSIIRRITSGGQTSLYAGRPAEHGTLNGPANIARLQFPQFLVVDSRGDVIFSQAESCLLRKISGDGAISELAGREYDCKPADGQGSEARFSRIAGLAIDANDFLYVSDGGDSQTVRKVAPDGTVSTLAGRFGQRGTQNGPVAAARFNSLSELTLDAAGHLFLADGPTIRRISNTGEVTLFAGHPEVMGIEEGDRLTKARFLTPRGLAFDTQGNLFVVDGGRIARISTTGMVLTAAGNPRSDGGANGERGADGIGSSAHLVNPMGIVRLRDGSMAFTDREGSTVRKLGLDGAVTTLAGQAAKSGLRDAAGHSARFNTPTGLLIQPDGSILVADLYNYRIRRLAPDGTVSTLAGSGWGTPQDGPAAEAKFGGPTDIVRDTAGNLYIADVDTHTIRKITPSGMVSTFAGKAGESGHADGSITNARFYFPKGLAFDAADNLYVADAGNRSIRKITPAGIVSTIAGTSTGDSTARDGQRELARFSWPQALKVDAAGNIYVADTAAQAIRKISPQGHVSTIAGALHSPGYNDEPPPYGRLSGPNGLVIDANGNLYFTDAGNAAIRRITPQGTLSTVIGVPGVAALRSGPGSAINTALGIAIRPDGRLVFTSEQAVVSD